MFRAHEGNEATYDRVRGTSFKTVHSYLPGNLPRLLDSLGYDTIPANDPDAVNFVGRVNQIVTRQGSVVVSNMVGAGYDEMGRNEGWLECSGTDATDCSGVPATDTTYDYDLAGRVTDFADGLIPTSGLGVDGQGKDTFYSYDGAGNISSIEADLFLGGGNNPTFTMLSSATYTPLGGCRERAWR